MVKPLGVASPQLGSQAHMGSHGGGLGGVLVQASLPAHDHQH